MREGEGGFFVKWKRRMEPWDRDMLERYLKGERKYI
jgi:hypothetical protein